MQRFRSWRIMACLMILLSGCGGGGGSQNPPPAGSSVGSGNLTVPNVVGLTRANAQAKIVAAGLFVQMTNQTFSPTVPLGNVISQDPPAGSPAKRGGAVNLVLSLGPGINVPDVTGLTRANAQAAITAAGLVVGTMAQAKSSTVPVQSIISQNPGAGTAVEGGTAVDLLISSAFTALIPTMTSARYGHTATLLSNGRVLLTGGGNGSASAYLNSAELYDPATNSFSLLTAAMNSGRAYHTATLLLNGKVLITGGLDVTTGFPLNTAELYDPTANTFTTLTASLTAARFTHTATLLSNGRVFLTGGYNPSSGYLDSAEIYDPTTNTFTALTVTMNAARAAHTAALLPNGRVLLAAGTNGNVLNTAEVYDPAANTFTTLAATLATARYAHTATLLSNGKVLLTGGSTGSNAYLNTAEVYDPATNTFTTLNDTMTAARIYHTATQLLNDKVLLAGGAVGIYPNTAEMYDP